MRYLFGLMCVCAIGVLPLVGCSESDGEGGAGGSAGTGGSAGNGGANTVTISALVTAWTPEDGNTGPLEGVEFCEIDTSNCVTTDASGNVDLELPADQEIAYTLEKEGYGSYLEPLLYSEDALALFSMATDARFEEMHGNMMSPYPMEGTGSVFIDLNENVAGATLALTGTTGESFYWDEDRNWDPQLSATTAAGGGGFTEVDPGEYQIEIAGTAENCVLAQGWPGDAANTVRFPIREGYLSTPRFRCDEVTP